MLWFWIWTEVPSSGRKKVCLNICISECSCWSVDLDADLCVCVQIPEENLFHCRVLYEDSVYAPLRGRQELEENVGIYLADNYEKITVPVPHFGGSDPADIIHDFHRVRANTHIWHSEHSLSTCCFFFYYNSLIAVDFFFIARHKQLTEKENSYEKDKNTVYSHTNWSLKQSSALSLMLSSVC